MNTKTFINLGIGAFALSTSSLTAQMVITDVTATATSEWGSSHISDDNLVNNSGLFTAEDTSVPAEPYDVTAVHGFDSGAANAWHSLHEDDDPNPAITFDLGGTYDLTGIYIWNGNQGGDPVNIDRGVQQFDLLLSTDGGNNYTEVLSDANLAQGVTDAFISAEHFDLTGNTGVTHVLMQIDSNYGSSYTGLSEVMVTAVPEPSTYALLLGGAACVIAMIRRRRR